ncbi:MAG: thiopurine S-methyltransferase [Burkholderiales bacterium]|nr:thiopurine S-methyltransferase [Burkholderiales bacterium]
MTTIIQNTQHEFWLQRWEANQIGFHREQINELLQRYYPKALLPDNPRSLVPLCGKSKDMLWLSAQGASILGCELSPSACEQFFIENQLGAARNHDKNFQYFQHDTITLACGDFFALPLEIAGELDFCYDRAALVALPADLRQIYAQKIAQLLPSGSLYLLITLSYSDLARVAPPYSISHAEVENLYAANFTIQHLETLAEQVTYPVQKSPVNNHVYLLKRK